MPKENFGLHVTLDLNHCSKSKLEDFDFVYNLLNTLPQEISMTKITLPYTVKWLDKFSKGTEAISGFVMIAESHISIHTFPDQDYVFMDVFSCREFDVERAVKYLLGAFDAKKHTIKTFKRGLDFPSKEHRPQNILVEN